MSLSCFPYFIRSIKAFEKALKSKLSAILSAILENGATIFDIASPMSFPNVSVPFPKLLKPLLKFNKLYAAIAFSAVETTFPKSIFPISLEKAPSLSKTLVKLPSLTISGPFLLSAVLSSFHAFIKVSLIDTNQSTTSCIPDNFSFNESNTVI